MGSTLNHADILGAIAKNFDEPILVIENMIEERKKQLKEQKMEKDIIKDELISRLDFLLKNPNMIKTVGLTLTRILMYKLKLKEELFPENLGGIFSNPEKKYIISIGKLLFDPYNQPAKKKGSKKSKGGDPGCRRGVFRKNSLKFYNMPNLAYPKMKDIKVRIPNFFNFLGIQ